MPSLTEIHEKLAAADNVIAAQNAELEKEAAEEEAAGRITARGFYDELSKLAAGAMGAEGPGMAPEPKADAATGNLGGKIMGKPGLSTGGPAAKAMKAPAALPGRTAKAPDVDTSHMMMGRSGKE